MPCAENRSNRSVKAVASASEHKLISGYPDNTFKPQDQAKRAEAVTVIAKALQLAS